MALESKSIDAETTGLADVYDSLIWPKKLWRNHNNKLYLLLRSFAAGKVGLTDTALALRNRFDPRYCDETDLYATAKLMGTGFKKGTGSLVRITVQNSDIQETKLFKAGIYRYQSVSGMLFSFQTENDYAFGPEEVRAVMAISQEKGSFPVGRSAGIKLFRSDNAGIDSAFVFSCEDNSGQLGYEDESLFDFRTRILNDADRQDHVKELEMAIRNLPNIFECGLVFNDGLYSVEYDGIVLAPKELLITITGVPTDAIADIVTERVVYDTHLVDSNNVVYYYNNQYIHGRRAVYFKYHDTTDFSLAITYQYDADKLKTTQIEGVINELFKPYTQMVTHLDTFGEKDVYTILAGLALPNVDILNADVLDVNNDEVSYVRIPKTRLPHLTGIAFSAVPREDAI
jgi:hypothetical protein